MRANNTQTNLSDDRQREYQRQQENLKAMAGMTDKVKPLSADLMIESLLKDSFKKPTQSSIHVEKLEHHNSELPHWLHCDSSMVPPHYKYLWSLVQSNLEFADTQKVSQLLLTSGLQVDVLGYIWNLVNKTVPGQLTKQEFFIVLTLVSLAQTGCSFNNLSVLKSIPGPPIPVLQVNVLMNQFPQTSMPNNFETVNLNSFQQFQNSPGHHIGPLKRPKSEKLSDQLISNPSDQFINNPVNETKIFNEKTPETKHGKADINLFCGTDKLLKTEDTNLTETIKGPYQNFPCIGSSPTAELEDDFSEFQSVSVEKCDPSESTADSSCNSGDDFTEFQSANVEHLDPFEIVVITQKREIPKIPLPKNLTGKLTNLKSTIKVSPESERKLKVLSQTEVLSSLPESKISSSNKVSTSISVLGSNHGIGSRLANHSLNAVLEKPKHHKHHKSKMNVIPHTQPNVEEEIIFGVKTTNIENVVMPKCCPKKPAKCKTFLLKETKIRNSEIPEMPTIDQVGSEFEPPVVPTGEKTRQIEIPMLGTFNETVLPTQIKPQPSGIDLISVQEDKYSALREIELEMAQDKPQKAADIEDTNEEFGDFLSANIPPSADTESAPAVITIASESAPFNLLMESNEKENCEKWSFKTEVNPQHIDVSFPSLNSCNVRESSEPLPSIKVEENPLGSFTLLTLNENDDKSNSCPVSQNLDSQFDFFGDIESSNTLKSSTISSKSDDSNGAFIFEGEQFVKRNSLSSQTGLPKITSSNSDNELWDFLSAETKPATDDFSRHGSLPSLDLKVSPAEESEQEVVWRKCMETCQCIIQEGFEIFNSIAVKSILDEVFSVPKTSDYLNCLNIAYQISKRVSHNSSELSSTQEDLDRLWRRLEDLCFEYNIKLKPDCEKNSESHDQCRICSGNVAQEFIKQGPNNYHPSCANLWINYVDATLPCSS